MRFIKSLRFNGLHVILLLIFLHTGVLASILPQSLSKEAAFKPGYGEAIGTVLMLKGTVYVVHAGMEPAYPMQDKTPIFKGDTIYTENQAMVRFQMIDGSIIALASQTQLTLTKSVYNPSEKTRASFLKMALGRARFYVVKMMQFKQNTFKVKTNTFVAGVRGSDFVITAGVDTAAVAALDNTTLEVLSLAAPEAEPVLLTDFQRTFVDLGGLPRLPEEIPRNEVESLKEEFSLEGIGFQEAPGVPGERGGADSGPRRESSAGPESLGGAAGSENAPLVARPDIVIPPPEEIPVPLQTDQLPVNGDQALSETEKRELVINVQEIQSDIKTIITDKKEDDTSRISELPPMPGRPQ